MNCDYCGDLGAKFCPPADKFLCRECERLFYGARQEQKEYKRWTGYA